MIASYYYIRHYFTTLFVLNSELGLLTPFFRLFATCLFQIPKAWCVGMSLYYWSRINTKSQLPKFNGFYEKRTSDITWPASISTKLYHMGDRSLNGWFWALITHLKAMQNGQSECHSVGNSLLSSLGTNYENLSTPMWGLRAWDIDWTLL